MINRDNFIETTIKKCELLTMGQCLDIRSYKRNRKVLIEKLEDGFTLYEDGFEVHTFPSLSEEKLEKLLRTIEKREFPRSHKLRFYILSSKEDSVSRAAYMIEEDEPIEEDTSFLVRINCDYSHYEIIKVVINKGLGIIEKEDFAHAVNLVVRLEQDLFDELSQLFFVRMHLL